MKDPYDRVIVKTGLLVGGHADGQRRAVVDGQTTIAVFIRQEMEPFPSMPQDVPTDKCDFKSEIYKQDFIATEDTVFQFWRAEDQSVTETFARLFQQYEGETND